MKGKGKMAYPDGSVYEGEMAQDRRNGVGKHSFASGHIYEGMFRSDKIKGLGEMTMGHLKYRGIWGSGPMAGPFRITNGDHVSFALYKDGKKIKWISEEAYESGIKRANI